LKRVSGGIGVLLLLAAGCSRAPLPQPRILYYYDPMHPAYRSDKPGIAPDCKMALVARYAGEVHDGAIHLTPAEERAAGIETVNATEQAGQREIRVPGKVAAPESRRYKVSGGADGLVQKVFAETGALVRQGQVLASYISRDVSTPQQGYIYALDAVDRVKKTAGYTQDQLASAVRQLDLAHETLLQLGMDEAQIAGLARTRTETREFSLTAPVDGIVTARNAASGTRFSKGGDLFEIAAIDPVWIEASVFAADAGALAGVASAHVQTPDGRRIAARRLPAVAQFDTEDSRAGGLTSLVRLEAANGARSLLPGMYVTVVFEVRTLKGLAVPAESVIDSGTASHVFVRRSDGAFEARRVATGWRTPELVQVLEGLRSGEAVARSGVFLLDSETRIRSGGVVQ